MQLSIKATFSTFLQRNCSILSKTSVQGLRVSKIVKGNQFQGVWGELEAKKKCFQRQSFTKYLRLSLVFI